MSSSAGVSGTTVSTGVGVRVGFASASAGAWFSQTYAAKPPPTTTITAAMMIPATPPRPSPPGGHGQMSNPSAINSTSSSRSSTGRNAARSRIELERLEIVEVVLEGLDEQGELAGQRGGAHRAVVDVHRHREPELVQQIERVVGQGVAPRGDRTGLQVRRRRQLERDLAVAHPTGQVAELHLHLVALLCDDLEVFGDAHTVAEAQRATVDQRERMDASPAASPACTVTGKKLSAR